MDATASVKLDNKSLFNKKTVKWLEPDFQVKFSLAQKLVCITKCFYVKTTINTVYSVYRTFIRWMLKAPSLIPRALAFSVLKCNYQT